ncbi:MAG: methyltransferase [Alphaproteobacteria bacterium]|nr:methyltransferase [Alphaproteobacteria bacterium]
MGGIITQKRSAAAPRTSESEDRLLGGAVRLRQPRQGYRAAIDPIFLAASVPAKRGERVLELGVGSGAAALCLAHRVAGCVVVGLERQRIVAALAARNAELNGMADRIEIVVGDLLDLPASVKTRRFDHVMANPPYLPPGRADRRKPGARDASDVEGSADLRAWVDCALRRVKPRGTVTFVHRADRLDALLAAFEGRAGGIVVIPLWPKAGTAAKRVIVRARTGVATPLILTAGLILHQPDGSFTQAAERILREGAVLEPASIGSMATAD